MTTSNGFTQKELNQMIFDKLDDIDKKLDEKLDKSEFYKVLGLVATVILIVGSLSMQGYSDRDWETINITVATNPNT